MARFHPVQLALQGGEMRRLARTATRRRGWRYLPYEAAINAAYYGRVLRWGIRGHDPARDVIKVRNPSALLADDYRG